MENNNNFTGYRTNHPDDIAHFASVRSFQDFLVDKTNPVVMVTLTINDKGFLDNATFETHLTQHTNAHDEFTIIVNDTAIDDFKGQVMKNSKDLLGENITIHFHQFGSVIYSFKGIIANICNKKNEGGGYGTLHISGYAPSIVLDGGKTCQSYENKTLPEIIAQATAEYPQESQIHIEGLINNEEKIPYTVQYNESDYQFIQRLAKRYGEFFYYNGTQYIFGSRAQKTITLYEGGDLREVEFELLLKPQKFNYLSYNSQMTRTEVKGSEQTEPQYKENPFQFAAIQASEKVFAKTTEQTYGALPDEFRGDYLKEAVQREKEKREQLMQVRGKSRNPHVRIGGFVKLKDINDLPMETYRVIDVTHYQGEGDYYNEFVAIPDVFVAYYYDEQALPRAEQQPARVIDNNDPEGWGRVRVQFIWQEKYQAKTPWIRVVQPHAGGGKGFYFIPEVGEEVWIDFEDQNAERPFVVGSNYNGKEYSPFHNKNNDIKAIQTRSGHKLIFTEDESILLSDKNGNTLRFDTQGKNIEISAPESISLCAGKDINLSAGNNLLMDVANVASFNILQQLLVNTPYMKQLVTELFHTQAGKALINSDNQIKIEAKETNVAGMQKLLLHSDQDAVVNSKGYLDMRGEQGNKMKNKAEGYEAQSTAPIIEDALAIVHFRPLPSWRGEFGFDWFRDKKNEEYGLVNEGAYSDTIKSGYGEKLKNKGQKTEEEREEDKEKAITNLKGEYTNIKIKKKAQEEVIEYFVPYLTLFSEDFIDNTLAKKKDPPTIFPKCEVELQIGIEVLEEIEKLEFITNLTTDKKEYLQIEEKISYSKEKSTLKVVGNIKITCKCDLTSNVILDVYAYPKGKTDKGSRKLAGRLLILKNDDTIRREEKIVLVETQLKIVSNKKSNKEKIKFDYQEINILYNTLHQALICPIVEKVTLDLTDNSQFHTGGEFVSGDNLIKHYKEKDGKMVKDREMYKKVRDYFLEKNDKKYKDYLTVFLFPIASILEREEEFVPGEIEKIGIRNAFLFTLKNVKQDYSTLAHEVLHGLGLYHTHRDPNEPYIYHPNKKYIYEYEKLFPGLHKITNIMRYGENGVMYTLHYWQWCMINNIKTVEK